jgi:hypothetical protein
LIPDQLAGLARALDLVPAEVGVPRLAGALQAPGRWLLVFDNAEHPDALARFLIAGPGHTIITSRPRLAEFGGPAGGRGAVSG